MPNILRIQLMYLKRPAGRRHAFNAIPRRPATERGQLHTFGFNKGSRDVDFCTQTTKTAMPALEDLNAALRQLHAALPPYELAQEPVAVAAPTEPARKFKWAASTDNAYRFDPSTARPHSDIYSVDWRDAVGVEKSRSGSEGVFFVETRRGAVVVKSGRWAAPATLASLIALRLGVCAPASRIVSTSSEEGVTLLESLKAVDRVGTVVTSLFDLNVRHDQCPPLMLTVRMFSTWSCASTSSGTRWTGCPPTSPQRSLPPTRPLSRASSAPSWPSTSSATTGTSSSWLIPD